jgi:PAS domain-containing protein
MEISNQRREDEDSSAGGSAAKNVISLSEAMRAQPIQRGRWPTGLVDALPAAVYTTDAAGRLTYFNEAAATLWGNRPTLGTTEFCGSWRLYWPDGTPMDAATARWRSPCASRSRCAASKPSASGRTARACR